jgi:hypothetical protein
MKTLCPIHHLFYMGNECPLCRQERIECYSQRFCNHVEVKKIEKDREITENDLSKLMNKFNSKKK